jgi:exodeoxyribonuclease VII large subunit
MWRSTASRLRFELHDGLQVVAAGPIEVYEARGTYQLIVQQLMPKGLGALELAFRQLQQKLAAEGLFDPQHKRPLPRFPRRIALVTSPTGAAVRDMLQVITRRWNASDLVIVPVPVQGEGAAPQIAAALRFVPRIPHVDVIITGRGGGSLEDLWPFNEEVVARAIYDSPIPVISAVGHEIDVSISDLVADRRALTPSEAAEIVVPLRSEVLADLQRLRDRLISALRQRAQRARLTLDGLATRRIFVRPLQRIHDLITRLDELDDRMRRAMRRRSERARQTVTGLASSLEALSPLKVIQRGYSVTCRPAALNSDGRLGEVIRSAAQLEIGDPIVTHLSKGRVTSRVEELDPNAGLAAKPV